MVFLFGDLYRLLVWLAGKVLIERRCPRLNSLGVLTEEAENQLQAALGDSDAIRPLPQVDYGAKFAMRLGQIRIEGPTLQDVQMRCFQYLHNFLKFKWFEIILPEIL